MGRTLRFTLVASSLFAAATLPASATPLPAGSMMHLTGYTVVTNSDLASWGAAGSWEFGASPVNQTLVVNST